MFRPRPTLFLALAALSAAPLLLPAQTSPAEASRPRIMASFAPIACFAQNVAGASADVEVLLPPNVGPHDHSMTPGDLKRIAAADVVVFNGLGLEDWLERAVRNAGRKNLVVIEAGEGLPDLISGTASHGAHGHHDVHGHGHEHGAVNPHVWLDPVLAVGMVENIRDGLAKVWPGQKEEFSKNARAYIVRLKALDAELRAGIKPLGNPAIVTFHDAFPYFARRYGIELAGVFELAPGRDPTPKHLASLTKMLRDRKAGALFAEPQYSPKIMEAVARETGVRVGVLDPIQTGKLSPGLYEEVMRRNLASLLETLDAKR